jgi:chromosome segregation protein
MQESTVKAEEYRQKIIEEEQASSTIKSDIAVYENDIKYSEEKINELNSRRNDEKSAKEKLCEEIKSAENKLEELNNKKQKIADEISAVNEQFRSFEEEASKISSDFEKYSSEINALYIKQNEYKFLVDAAQKSIDETEFAEQSLHNKEKELSSGFVNFENDIVNLEKRLEKANNNANELKNKLSGYGMLYKSRQDSFENAKVEFEKTLFTLKEKQQKRKLLIDLENNMEGFAGSVKNILKASKQGMIGGISGTVAQNINVEAEYAVAIETALGGAMQNIIVENEDIAKRCIRYLKEQKGGRATFLPITSVKGYELKEAKLEDEDGFVNLASRLVEYDEKFSGIIYSLLGRIVVAEDIDSATLIAKKYGYKFRIVTLDGQVINAGGSFTGGSVQKSAGVITRKNEIEKLDAEIEKLTSERDQLKEKAEKIRAEVDKMRYDAEGAKELLNQKENEIVQISSEINSLKALSSQNENQLEEIKRQLEENNKKAEAAKNALSENKTKLEEITDTIKKSEEKLREGDELKSQLSLQREEYTNKISEHKLTQVELAKDYEAQENEIEKLKSELEKFGEINERIDLL